MAKSKKISKIKIKFDHTKRKMSKEELTVFLRESKRGVGPHAVKKGKGSYNRKKNKIKREDTTSLF